MHKLSREEAIALLTRIAHSLQQAEDSEDFCFWLAEVFEKDAGIKLDLKSEVI